MTDPEREEDVSVTRHPPERRRSPITLAAAGCCCCCCCCCVHSILGLVGAGLGSARKSGETPPRYGIAPPKAKTEEELKAAIGSSRSAVGLYWMTLVVLTVATGAVTGFNSRGSEAGFAIFCVVGLGLPLIQLAASLVALVIVMVGPFKSRGAAGEQIGMITLKAFLWGLGGVALMALAIPFLK
jgi:streptolysin S family bacteriocin protoxin